MSAVAVFLALFFQPGPVWAGAGSARAVTVLPRDFLQMHEGDRVSALSAYFDPKPGEKAVLESPEKQEIIAGQKISPDRLRGYIRVNPPKGRCLKVEIQSPDSDPQSRHDVTKLCKPGDVVFRLGDMDEFGEINAVATTGPDDQGTRLSWATPYRVAFVIPNGIKLPAESTPLYVRGCTATKSADMGRRVFVDLFTGERWFIRFPPTDMPVDPGPQINLDTGDVPIVKGGFGYRAAKRRSKVREAREAAKLEADIKAGKVKPPVKDNPEKADKADDGHGGGQKKPAKKAKATPPPTPEPSKGPFTAMDFSWKISRYNTFVMPSGNFMPDGALPPGMIGECRYSYETSSAEFPEGGLIECHGADRFAYVYLPLTCISGQPDFLVPREKLPEKKEEEPTPAPTPKPH
jgi:hypothetical protein